MPIYKTILCPVDFSTMSQLATERAAEFARQYAARLILLHVVEYFPGERSNALIPPEDADPATYERKTAEQHLDDLSVKLGHDPIEKLVIFSHNSAWHQIVKIAAERQIDLIVQGSHGLHTPGAFLGSTATAVINHAACDVLTVRRGQ